MAEASGLTKINAHLYNQPTPQFKCDRGVGVQHVEPLQKILGFGVFICEFRVKKIPEKRVF
jgi:hypothetical protein